ncbi:hypothetical protein KCP73_13355 [Salmonella enterica subsp. enterica]|nr:hypothetical protein KCP73_13355 [Salmonella enterica subsp. enterica]
MTKIALVSRHQIIFEHNCAADFSAMKVLLPIIAPPARLVRVAAETRPHPQCRQPSASPLANFKRRHRSRGSIAGARYPAETYSRDDRRIDHYRPASVTNAASTLPATVIAPPRYPRCRKFIHRA